MIVGNGLIANLFRENDRENVVFFASGDKSVSYNDLIFSFLRI